MILTGDPVNLGRLYKELVSKDWFMTLLDLREYIAVKEQMLADYEDERSWARKSLVNIAKAGYFSSDRTIEEYNKMCIRDRYTIAIGLWRMLEKEYIDNWYTSFAASAVLISIPIAILFLCMQKYYVNGMSGAVKG